MKLAQIMEATGYSRGHCSTVRAGTWTSAFASNQVAETAVVVGLRTPTPTEGIATVRLTVPLNGGGGTPDDQFKRTPLVRSYGGFEGEIGS